MGEIQDMFAGPIDHLTAVLVRLRVTPLCVATPGILLLAPHVPFYLAISLPRRLHPYNCRKMLAMLFKLMKVCFNDR